MISTQTRVPSVRCLSGSAGATRMHGALLAPPAGENSGWSVEDIDTDPPEEGEVLIEPAASGMCHSDAHIDTGDMPLDCPPGIGRHEGAGGVKETSPVDGEAVRTSTKLLVKDR